MSVFDGGLFGASGSGGGGGGGTVPTTVLNWHTDTSAGTTALLGGDITGLDAGGVDSISIVLGGVAGNVAKGTNSVAIGHLARTSAGSTRGIAVGYNASTTASDAISVGGSAVAGSGSTSMGYLSTAGVAACCYGSLAVASGSNSCAFGRGADATAQEANAFGSNAQATQIGAYAFGGGDNTGKLAPDADGVRSGAFGAGAVVTGTDSVQFGDATNSTADTFQISGKNLVLENKLPRAITAFADKGDATHVVVTSAQHGRSNSDSVVITGTTSYNGTFTVTNVTATTFEIVDTWVANDATGSNELATSIGTEVFLDLPTSAGTAGSLYSNSGVVTVA